MAPVPEPTIYDLAYRGKTAAVKILLNENEKLKTETDGVCIILKISLYYFDCFMSYLFLQNKRMLIHWAALGGHDDLVIYLLSLGSPVDPTDDVSLFY